MMHMLSLEYPENGTSSKPPICPEIYKQGIFLLVMVANDFCDIAENL